MKLTKKIGFDENSMPPKDQIGYKGKGKFYEFKGGKGVVVYDLNSMPTQEEQEELVTAIQEKNPDFVIDEDKSLLPQILSEILNLATSGPEIPHAIQLSGSPQAGMTTVAALAEIGLTLSEVQAAARGERTGVMVNRDFFPIFSASDSDILTYIRFGRILIDQNGPYSWVYWDISIFGDEAQVLFYTT